MHPSPAAPIAIDLTDFPTASCEACRGLLTGSSGARKEGGRGVGNKQTKSGRWKEREEKEGMEGRERRGHTKEKWEEGGKYEREKVSEEGNKIRGNGTIRRERKR